MPDFRITMLFNKTSGEPAAESERWDINASSQDAAVTTAQRMIVQRQAFLPANWKIVSARVGLLSAFKRVDNTWRLKQVSVQVCNPPSSNGNVGGSDVPGTAVYYQLKYTGKLGKPVVRLFRPLTASWWKGGSSQGFIDQTASDPAIGTWLAWMNQNGHQLTVISPTSGTITRYSLGCWLFVRSATRKVGRPFGLRRGRKFAHRTHRP